MREAGAAAQLDSTIRALLGARRRRIAAVSACLLVSAGAALWVGLPSPWLVALAAVHAAVLVLRPRWVAVLLATDCGLMAIRGFALAPMYFGNKSDTWMHLAIIRRVVENGPFPPDPFCAGYSSAPILSLVHQLYGGIAWLTGQPIDRIWLAGIPVVVVLTGAVAYFAHRELLGDCTAAFFAAMFYLVSRYFEWPHASYPRVIGPGFSLLSLGLFWRGRRTHSRRLFVAAGLVLGLATAVHPITGLMGSSLLAAVLLGEWALEVRAGRGRAFLPTLLAVAVGTAITAGPWIVYDLFGMLQGPDTAPIFQDQRGGLGRFLSIQATRILRGGVSPGEPDVRWGVLCALPVLLGAARVLAPGCERRIRVYVAAAAAVALLALWSPLTGPLVAHLGPRYVARFFYELPFPALAGFGLAWGFRQRGAAGARVAAAAVFALYTALLLRSVDTRMPLTITHPPPELTRPELAALEPLLRDRVVLAGRSTAYELPYFTGAFVVWSPQAHLNPWVWDRERARGARSILEGRAKPDAIRAFCERHAVEFALLSEGGDQALGPLLATGEFQRRTEVPGYILLERRIPAR